MGKTIRNEDLRLNVIIKGDQGKKELGELETQYRSLKRTRDELLVQKKKLRKTDKDYAQQLHAINSQLKENKAALNQNQAAQAKLREKIGLTGLTMKQLRSEAARLQAQLNNMTKGVTPGYDKIERKLKEVQMRMTQVRTGAGRMRQSFDKIAAGANKYIAIFAAIAAAVYQVVNVLGKWIRNNALLADSVSDVMKTTGLAKEQVHELIDEFREFNTRTPRSELMKLAEEAGRTGKKTKAEVKEFVKYGNMIGTALGDDLGGETAKAIKEVGKLVEVFKVSQRTGKGFGDSMLAVAIPIRIKPFGLQHLWT